MRPNLLAVCLLLLISAIAACQPSQASPAANPAGAAPLSTAGPLRVLAVESFLADIAQQVAGDRVQVETLMPLGLDPHAFEPTPQDVVRVADADVLIVNGAGFEGWLEEVLANAGGERLLVEAAAGLTSREAPAGEEAAAHDDHEHAGGDPHFWLDPTKVITYVENIRVGLTNADPAGAATYAANAAAYSEQLTALDAWITEQVEQIPPARRLLVTNHESFGYFADRYGLRVIGAVIPSVSTNSTPSAQQLAQLADQIRATGAPAIFLETGANPQLAEQLAAETGVSVVTDLYSHSITRRRRPRADLSGADAVQYAADRRRAQVKKMPTMPTHLSVTRHPSPVTCHFRTVTRHPSPCSSRERAHDRTATGTAGHRPCRHRVQRHSSAGRPDLSSAPRRAGGGGWPQRRREVDALQGAGGPAAPARRADHGAR